jgi:hypothetical protein
MPQTCRAGFIPADGVGGDTVAQALAPQCGVKPALQEQAQSALLAICNYFQKTFKPPDESVALKV